MKILFLTRKYPPITGGMQNQSYNLIENFKKINKETFTVINRKGNKYLLLFLPYAYFKVRSLIRKHGITHLHLGDGMMAIIGARLKRKTGVKTAITIHGLDITFMNKIYQRLIPKRVNELDTIICISENTKKECVKRGIDKKKIVIVSNGVNPDEFIINKPKKELRESLAEELKIDLKGKKVLFTSGRLVKRKGVEWFVLNVMPKLPDTYVYLVAGDGEERENIEKAIKKRKLEGRVFLLGKVKFAILKLLYNSADLFVMPNISVAGNVEGFGLVAVEASSCGLPVVASNVDGIPAAIVEGKTGWLVREKDADGFVKRITGKGLDGRNVRGETVKRFAWGRIVGEYKKVLEGRR